MKRAGSETLSVKSCGACGSGLLERDKFCRWCGVSQQLDRPGEFGRSVSGPLVTAVVEGLSNSSSLRGQSGLRRRAVTMLVSLPVWLIIVLLSPFDAYAAAKDLARGI